MSFAHQEYILIAMLKDDNENVRNVRMANVLAHRKQVAGKSANNNDCPQSLKSSLIRSFDVPTLNLKANAYHKLANFDFYQQKPSALASLTDTEIEECLKNLCPTYTS